MANKVAKVEELMKHFSQSERAVLREAATILKSDKFKILKKAAQNGEFAEVTIDGRKVMIEPDFASDPTIRAMTWGDDFILSPKLFEHGDDEIGKTILQELHRLKFSSVVKTGSIDPNAASSTTTSASESRPQGETKGDYAALEDRVLDTNG